MPPTSVDLSGYRPTAADSPAPDERSLPGLVVRLLIIGAGAALLVTSVIAWAVGDVRREPVSYRPVEGSGEGVYIIVAAGLVIFLAARPLLLETTNRWLQLAPIAAVIVAVAMWFDAHRRSLGAIDEWEQLGGRGMLTDGPLISALAIALLGLCAGALEIIRPQVVRAQTRRLGADTTITSRDVATFVVAASAGLFGAVLGLAVMLVTFGEYGLIGGSLLSVLGFMAGVWIATRLLALLAERLDRRRG